ncbi:UNVERIFIED_CONTAM: Metal tolerance protein 9 [Sesamum calycinum]|uniref:Metal tolerance protein 9 n=1 Tax=Sesamum calycinum TaxID=2727403 RepID=A0AAW2Q5M6_9LAMI
MESSSGCGVGESRRELLGAEEIEGGQSSWRLNINEFRLPERGSDHRHQTFSLERLLRNKRKQRKVAEYYKQQERLLEGFNEMETIHESGCLPDALTEIFGCHCINNGFFPRPVIWADPMVYFPCHENPKPISLPNWKEADATSGKMLYLEEEKGLTVLGYTCFPFEVNKGIIVFASVMATLGLQIILESVRQLIAKTGPDMDHEKEKWMIGIMVSVTVVKFVLMIYCRRFKNEIVRAYAQDHLFDVITNSIGLATAVLAVRFYWWIDPTGAIIIAIYTINTWAKTVVENVWSLIGRTAPPDFLAKLTYLIWNHHKEIQHIDTVRAYTFGSHYFVEVDIVLPEDMLLSQAHNIGETLQEKLEQLPEVERAFVHIDFEFTHRPEHKSKV